MSDTFQIDEQQLRQRVGEAAFERGRAYAQSGAIRDPRRQGRALRAL
jgi:uncharacterized Zn finger protein